MKQRVGIQGADNLHQGITSATASPSGKCKIDLNIVHSPPPHAPSTQQLRHDMLPIPFTPPNAASSQIYQFIPFPPIPISRLVPPPRKYQSSQHGTLPPLDDRKKEKEKENAQRHTTSRSPIVQSQTQTASRLPTRAWAGARRRNVTNKKENSRLGQVVGR